MGKCGGGMFLRINEDHNFKLWMSCGSGTNSRGELMALWKLLQFASLNGIVSLHVFGDSRVIINWSNDLSKLQVLSLELWCQRIITLLPSFLDLSIRHIFR